MDHRTRIARRYVWLNPALAVLTLLGGCSSLGKPQPFPVPSEPAASRSAANGPAPTAKTSGKNSARPSARTFTSRVMQSGPPYARETVTIRGHAQSLHLYGTRGNLPVIVSSGDGGWMHLGPHVAEVLASHGFFVVGFDVKDYLEGFTSGKTTLRAEDVPGDYKVLADFAARGSNRKPILIGVSEGAGLSVLAATDPRTRTSIAGVIGLGLPDLNELGWRWRDSLIYITHGAPNEPTFSTAAIVKRIGSTPLGAIHSTRDEYVKLAEVQRVFDAATEPRRLWIIKAADHRFSDNLPEFDQRLLEATDWIAQQQQQQRQQQVQQPQPQRQPQRQPQQPRQQMPR